MELSSEQVQAIREGQPVPVMPPEVGQECVLVRKDVYGRVKEGATDDRPASLVSAGGVPAAREDEGWREFGRRQLARAYGDDEPEYSVGDIKPELES